MKILLFSLIAALVTGCKGQVAVARFRDAAYHVVEGEKIFSVVVEKIGSSTRVLTAFIRYNRGTATPPSDYPSIPQTAQIVRLPRHSSAQITANLTVDDDTVLECNETFTLTLESFSSEDLLTIDPAGNQTVVTIIDDDEGTVVFSGSRSIMEGTTGFITVSILQSISQSFTVTVESYECTRDDIFAATPGEDYVPVNNTILTFTETTTFHRIDIVTLQDTRYEGDGESEILCLRIFNLVEPCLSYVSVGADVQVLIEDDDTPNFTIFCHTVASGNSLTGWTIDLFYSTFRFFDRFTAFRCALNDATLSGCPGPSPAPYGPLSYANHTVTIEGISVFGTQKITHQILIVLGRLRLYNSSAIQLSIQSTKNSTYECRLNNVKDGRYFTCNDDDIIAGLPPNTYNLTVRATSTDDSYQTAIDVAGPITLTGGSAVATCSGGVNLVTMDVSASTYRARWRARGERIVFELAGRGQGWVGIGFSYNRIQTQSDIVLGAADETGYFVDDRFAFVTEQTTPPPHDATQNVKDTFASFENGVTTVKFSRVRNTGDVNDYSLSDCIFFLYAWGGEVFNITTGAIAYHGINRRFVSDSLVCIPISQTFCPEQFDCDPPPTPGNGSVTYDNMLEGSVANYSCNNGFRLVGDDQTVCQANATWSGAVPICIVDCGDLDAPENGDVVYDETLEGYVASYSCNFGYRLDGDDQRVCQTDSIWSGVVPSCIHIDCGSPGTVVNGTVDSNGTYLTSVATFTCDIGFHLFGDRQRICQLDGTWSNMVPGCSHCGFPDVPSNGDGAVISTTLGSIVVYTCSDTYALCGDKTRTCLSNRMWSGSVPNCTRAVATVDFTSYTVDEDASSTVIGILLDQPNCVNVIIVLTPQEQSPVDASTLDFNSNPILVTIIAGDTSGTATIPITNDSIVEGNESFDTVLTTNSRGVIIGTPGQADVTIVDDEDSIDCGDPGKPANGTANYTDTLVGSVVTYDCDFATCTSDSPFALCGNSSRTCLPTGMWSGSIPECIKSLVTIKRTEYTAKESDGFVDVTILVDTPNCKPITVIVQPKEQTPVDASVADFDDSPIIITIVPGDTDATVSIPITNDTILESDEKFDIVIDASGIGVALGYPKQAEVTIAGEENSIYKVLHA